MRVGVIGGGAAGFFAALQVGEQYPQAEVCIFEKSHKLLSKVRISGGGRCNLTNGSASIKAVAAAYPRGQSFMKRCLRRFGTQDTMTWFEANEMPVYIQEDGRVFPKSNDSQSVINCFLRKAGQLNVSIYTGRAVRSLSSQGQQWSLHFAKAPYSVEPFDKVIVATGGAPKYEQLAWLETLGHEIISPVPSLFTFNMPDAPVTRLMGISVENCLLRIQGTKLESSGPLLITHWGMSGPAVLQLSAFGARVLHQRSYSGQLQVNWTGERNHQAVMDALNQLQAENRLKQLTNTRPFELPQRLWMFLLGKAGVSPEMRWCDLGKKSLNKITHTLCNDEYSFCGKTTFKEEFVTCGGISLSSIHAQSMQSRICPGLYFAGEVLDIDGITGGYNFQAAWTTAYIAGQLL